MTDFTFKLPPAGVEPCNAGELRYDFTPESISVRFYLNDTALGPELKFSPEGGVGSFLGDDGLEANYKDGSFQDWFDRKLEELRTFGRNYKS